MTLLLTSFGGFCVGYQRGVWRRDRAKRKGFCEQNRRLLFKDVLLVAIVMFVAF